MRIVTLSYDQSVTSEGTSNRVTLAGGPVGTASFEFLHVGHHSISQPAVLDGYLMGFLLYAAEHADRLVIEGPITAGAVRNATLLAETWRAWAPERYGVFEIEPEQTMSDGGSARIGLDRGSDGRAIAGFSGGVDSMFTALRHSPNSDMRGRFKATEGVMVHGFDVRHDNQPAFDELVRRVDPFLDSLGLRRRIVRTDVRRLLDGREVQEWEHAFGGYLASVLHQFSDTFEFGLIASGEPITHQVFPWGSTPMTDHLLSGGLIDIVHDGVAFTRTEKVARIAKSSLARRLVKVCWAGVDQGRNCGVCEKCVRTRLNFRAVGVAEPGCFDAPFELTMIDTLVPQNALQMNELTSLISHCERRGLEAEWVSRLRSRLREFEHLVT